MADEPDSVDHILDLNDLCSTEFGLTTFAGGNLAEAATVCLEDQDHDNQAQLLQRKHFADKKVAVRRLEFTTKMVNSHNDAEKATYEGAEGIAILVVARLGTACSFARAKKGGGFDYWFSEDPDIDHALYDSDAGRLEVSGIRSGTEAEIRTRLKKKVDQTKKSDADYGQRKTYVVVVEFGRPQTWVKVR